MGNPQFEEHEMVAEADQVLVRWTVRGIHEGTIWGAPPTGKPFAIEGANVFRVRDGKIVERRSFLDPTGVLALLSD
jgi:predicted ester cyclase